MESKQLDEIALKWSDAFDLDADPENVKAFTRRLFEEIRMTQEPAGFLFPAQDYLPFHLPGAKDTADKLGGVLLYKALELS